MKKLDIIGYIGNETNNPYMLAQFLDQAAGEDVEVRVISYGGSFFDAMAMRDMIKAYKGKTTAKIYGFAMSSGSIITTGFDEVQMSETGTYQMHNNWQVTAGDAEAHIKSAKMLDKTRAIMIKAYAQKSGLDESKVKKLAADDTYMSGTEAKELGFVDTIMSFEDEATEIAKAIEIMKSEENASMKIAAYKPSDVNSLDETIKKLFANNVIDKDDNSVKLKNGNTNTKLKAMKLNTIFAQVATLAAITLPEDMEANEANMKQLASLFEGKINALKQENTDQKTALDVLKADKNSLQARVNDAEDVQKFNEVLASAGVTQLPEEHSKVLKSRIKALREIQNDDLKATVESTLVDYVKANAVEEGADPSIESGGASNRAAASTPDSYEGKLHAKVEQLMKADATLTLMQATAQAKSLIQK